MSAKQVTLTQDGEDTLTRIHGGTTWPTGAMQTDEDTKTGQLTITIEIPATKPNRREFYASVNRTSSGQEGDGEWNEFMRLRALEKCPKPRHLISEDPEVDGYTQ